MTKHSGTPNAGRALAPSNDTRRIASTLNPVASLAGFERDDGTDLSATPPASLSAAAVEAVIQARALRAAHLPPELFSDPAWDMLLELLHAQLTHRRITPGILCKAADVQPGAGRRWMEALAAKGLCIGPVADPDHGDIRLSKEGSRVLHAYFAALEKHSSSGLA